MAKKPDLSDLTDKFNLSGIVDNIKSLVNPGGDTPNVDPNDALGVKIAKISIKIQELVAQQEAHSKSLAEINKLLNAAFKDLEAIREEHGATIDEADKAESTETEDAVADADTESDDTESSNKASDDTPPEDKK
tara:strand:- start:1194 stop:1595 length:402 start_codon:yes stop_codon:yes gene_type:complete